MVYMINNIWKIIAGVSAFIIGFLYKRNTYLSKDKIRLKREVLYKDKQIKIKNEVINVIKNHEDKPLSGNVERMRTGKL